MSWQSRMMLSFCDFLCLFVANRRYLTRRLLALMIAAAVGCFGLWLWRCYRGPGRIWLNYYATAAIYEIFWCLFVFSVWPRRRRIGVIVVVVFLVTCGLEFMQLWQPAFLQDVRSTLLGAAVIGTDFAWWQFPHYILGCLVAWLLLCLLSRLCC
jgi:hypothetical protein